MAELYGKVEGCSGGYGGSMHLYDVEVGNLGANAVVGGGLPGIVGAHSPSRCAASSAWPSRSSATARRTPELPRVAEPRAVWKVPAIFCLENNGWAESTPASQQLPLPGHELGKRAAAFGMKLSRADGRTSRRSTSPTLAAREHALSGRGPFSAHCARTG
jgi:pyruvate dehydrogenase E1 component alpha subunit